MTAIIAAAITLAEARACPMLALLHALICHMWCAAHKYHPSKPALASSPRLVYINDTTSSAQQQLQPEQQQGQDSETATDARSGSSGSPDAAAALAGTLQQQGMQTEAEDLSGRRHGMPDRQRGVSEGQLGVFDGQPEQHQHQQAAQQTFTKPSVQEGVSHQSQMQAVHCEMLVCAIALQLLPCVAWLKQLPHARQLAAWQDAVPCAVLALHASMSVMAVSISLSNLQLQAQRVPSLESQTLACRSPTVSQCMCMPWLQQ